MTQTVRSMPPLENANPGEPVRGHRTATIGGSDPAAEGLAADDSAMAGIRRGFLALFAIAGGLATWLAFAPVEGAVQVTGLVETARPVRAIQHAEGGLVDALFVSEGAMIRAGDIIARLDTDALDREIEMRTAVYADLIVRRARVEAERDGRSTLSPPTGGAWSQDADLIADSLERQQALLDARQALRSNETASLEAMRRQTGIEVAALRAESAAVRIAGSLVAEELSDQEKLLAVGLAQAGRVRDLRREAAALAARDAAVLSGISAAVARADDATLAVAAQSLARRESALDELQSLASAEPELLSQLSKLRARRSAAMLRAPVSGRILALNVEAGEVLRPAETLATILPIDDTDTTHDDLVVVAGIPPDRIGQISEGSEVWMRLRDNDAARVRHAGGTIRRLLPPDRNGHPDGPDVFRAVISLENGGPAAIHALQPGQHVTVSIVTGPRSAAAYLISPLADYLSAALRED